MLLFTYTEAGEARRRAVPPVGFSRFYRTVSRNRIRSANRPALLFILVTLVEVQPAENITFVMEPADKKIESHHCAVLMKTIKNLFTFNVDVDQKILQL